MKYYAVIDTNVLVSAMLKWNSVPGNVMELAFDGPIIPVYSAEILKEYREVLLRPKFHLTEDVVNDVLDGIENRGINVEADTLEIILPDPKDRVFYEVVLEERKTEDAYLVTGNIKHFPVETFVVTPRKMLDIVFSETDVEWQTRNPICIDINNVIDGDAAVYIADSNFCAYNDDLEMVEIVWPSEEFIEIVGDNDEPIELTYENALLCMKKVEDSFICFLEKLSRNEYEDLEELLEDW